MSLLNQLIETESQQRILLEQLKNSGKRVLLYGAGVYAYVVRSFLAASGISVSAVVVDAAYKVDDVFMDLKIVALEQSIALLKECHVVVGITSYPEVVERLRQLEILNVHVVDIPDYLNMPHRFMSRDFVAQNIALFEQAANSFEDGISASTYVASLNTKINEDLSFIKPHVRQDNLYFPAHEFGRRDDEVFLDIGGYTGDTVREFHHVSGGKYSKIISLEPSAENFQQLLRTIDSLQLDRVQPIQIGAWDERATLRFQSKEMHIDNQITSSGNRQIEVDTVDSILRDQNDPITLIKLDINGAEFKALSGAVKTIQTDRPRIVTRLHTKEDYFRIPLLLKEIAPDIKLYLRQRSYMSMMVILYGVFDSEH